MSNGDEIVCSEVEKLLTANGVEFTCVEQEHATQFQCRNGPNAASITVYNSGKMVVGGKKTQLRGWLEELKGSIEAGSGAPQVLLPAEIEKFPTTLREKVPACDDVVLWFFQESLRCYKADSPAAAAFMLGAASEKAILLLIESYCEAIKDEVKRQKFKDRINIKLISKKYDEFKSSYAGCKSKPTDPILSQDLTAILDGAFNFYRHTRNSVGHPQMIPDLDKGVILANMGQFISYIERIYGLIEHFKSKGVEV